MSGYQISIYRQQNDGSAPPSFKAPQGPRLALWQAGGAGLAWLDELVRQQKMICLGGDYYPVQYTAMAKYVIPQLRKDPGFSELDWVNWALDTAENLVPGWLGKPAQNPDVVDACRPDEWLIIDAWDLS
ncbi:MAG: hypothetical protein QOH88_473 [Verrucomicrobiota bacterium]|jgi:hypothetical protein